MRFNGYLINFQTFFDSLLLITFVLSKYSSSKYVFYTLNMLFHYYRANLLNLDHISVSCDYFQYFSGMKELYSYISFYQQFSYSFLLSPFIDDLRITFMEYASFFISTQSIIPYLNTPQPSTSQKVSFVKNCVC